MDKKIEIKGNKDINIPLKKLINYQMNDIENKKIVKNTLELESYKSDPYIIFDSQKIKNSNKPYLDKFIAFTSLILIYFILYKLISYLKFKKKELGWYCIVYIGICILILIFPILRIDKNERDVIENRNLAKSPYLFKDKKINLNYGKEIELWINDHFYKRRLIIDNYEKINKKLIGRIENDRAFVAKDNWIFYKGENSIENYQNINLFSEEQLKVIRENLLKRNKWLSSMNIKYYTFIAPDKIKFMVNFILHI